MPSIQDIFQDPAPVALVTGSGAPRVGRAIAAHLAGLGCRLALHAHRSIEDAEHAASKLRDDGCEVIVVRGAVDRAEEVEAFVAAVAQHFGRIDILINSAAIWAPKRLEEVTAEDVRSYLEVNTLGSFIAAKAAGLQMVAQPRGGAIVNIGDWAISRPYLDHAAYFPSKGSIEAMTRSLAVELAERNRAVRVNCIHPGPVLMAEEVSQTTVAAIAESTLLKRIGTPEHVAHAVQFLIENDFVTGVALPVDGGRTIYANEPLQTAYRTG
ncbi:MAG: SDR family oxidoreductase [Pirellulaceae bacterium]